jgi:ribose transport system permease protein
LGPFFGLAVVIVFFAVISGNPGRYLSTNNLRIVLTQTVIVALGAIGMTVIIISGGIDLSVGSVIALSGVSAAIASRRVGSLCCPATGGSRRRLCWLDQWMQPCCLK